MTITIVEYGTGVELNKILLNGLTYESLIYYLRYTNEKIRANLGVKKDVLQVADGYLRAMGVAGIIQLAKGIEIEIVPKFLNTSSDDDWKSALYLLATLSKYGTILPSDRVSATASYINSLYDIAGRILAQEYTMNRRKLTRKYRKEVYSDYAIDGDLDTDALFERQSDGLKQSRIFFDRKNAFNATIQAAMKAVSPFISDTKTRNILSAAITEYGSQDNPRKEKLRLPSRNAEWTLAYNLSYDVLSGLRGSFAMGHLLAPGFIVDTWRIWEWVITYGLSFGYKRKNILVQHGTKWGWHESNGNQRIVNVYPDVEIVSDNDPFIPLFLVDAKYKFLSNINTSIVDRSDIYEAFAFCHATNTKEIVLAYPLDANSKPVGNVSRLASYLVGDVMIHIAMVSFGSIQEKGGMYNFGRNLSSGISSLLSSNTSIS